MENTTSFGHSSDSFEQRQAYLNFELAKLQLSQDTDIERIMHSNKRKAIALIGGGLLLFVIMILGFMVWCLHIGKEQFVIDFLKYSLYPLSAGGGFWAGRISMNHNREHPFNPIQP